MGEMTAEMDRAQQWLNEAFRIPAPGSPPAGFPLSFRYDGRPLVSLLADWKWSTTTSTDPDATRQVVTLRDPDTGLECRCEATAYTDFPAVEWIVYLRNGGQKDTPIIADIQPLDARFAVESKQPVVVHHARGSLCQLDDFAPLETPLRVSADFRMEIHTGRSSSTHLPFFNLEMGEQGVIGAIGWTGGWAAGFERDRDGVQVRAGMERTHLRLHPGEEIRTPRILLLFWDGDRIHGHNLLRRVILAHYTPRPKGQLLEPPIADAVWGERTEALQIAKARWLKDNDIPVDTFWIDAGWYGDRPYDPEADTFGTAWARQVGEWKPLKAAYPNGLKPVGDALKELGLGFVLWVEPERAFDGTEVTREHPEWLLGPVPTGSLDGANWLYNLGIPEARRALTDRISDLIDEAGVTCYRQDFNFVPVPCWEAADAPDRIGMAEIRHIEGLYAFWDELLERHPGLIIDNCSSGGRRIDLETISRSVPLWRSDVQCYEDFDPIAMQTQTHGLSMWVPLSTGCCRRPTKYACRSALGPGMVVDWCTSAVERGIDLPVDTVRELMSEVAAMRRYFYGDFYPLVSFSLADDAWAVWQFDRPDLQEGIVLALRRPVSPFASGCFRLQGLDPQAQYAVADVDGGSSQSATGRSLMDDGLTITIADQPGSALLLYNVDGECS
jgi:alpha-galactosidase